MFAYVTWYDTHFKRVFEPLIHVRLFCRWRLQLPQTMTSEVAHIQVNIAVRLLTITSFIHFNSYQLGTTLHCPVGSYQIIYGIGLSFRTQIFLSLDSTVDTISFAKIWRREKFLCVILSFKNSKFVVTINARLGRWPRPVPVIPSQRLLLRIRWEQRFLGRSREDCGILRGNWSCL